VAVERIAAGQRPARYTAGEMRAAVELLTARGMSGRQVAARIGCTRRTVQRYRRLCEAEQVRREWYEAGRVEAERPARGAD
jgi:transposase